MNYNVVKKKQSSETITLNKLVKLLYYKWLFMRISNLVVKKVLG